MKDQLAERIKLGDEQAFELLFRKYYVRLCSFANKFLNDPDQAKEIVQEVFVKIWERRKDIDPEDSLKSYLFKVAQNLSINKLRRKKVESRYTEIYKLVYIEQQEFSAHESLLARELEENIACSIGKLPAECRKVFELSRIEGLKYKEIADTLHISVKTVEAQMSKALRFLRIELSDYLTLFLIALICSNL
ncbi:MAG: RNA polymerase sigma-70 factor [Bacteroidales bacterium]|nr:RNA polymerase sigma-70 factor [Bacteroidales bacterium]